MKELIAYEMSFKEISKILDNQFYFSGISVIMSLATENQQARINDVIKVKAGVYLYKT